MRLTSTRSRIAHLKDRIIGCLLGGALGDAWGGSTEGIVGPSPFQIPSKPTLSDDTQLTLATCESIIEVGRVDPENLASHFLRWFQAGRIRGLGSSTLKAMRDLAAGTHWAVAGPRGEYSAGNGAAMRIAPLAFLLDPGDLQDRVLIRDVCRITHHNDEAYSGALAVLLAIHAAISGAWRQQGRVLSAVVDSLPDSAVRDRIEEIQALPQGTADVAGKYCSSGYVVDTVPLALYCAQFIESESFSTLLARTVSLGGDTDTIASIAGQIAGAAVGATGVPQKLLADVNGADEASAIAETFADFVVGRTG